jgi:hypothetical protein
MNSCSSSLSFGGSGTFRFVAEQLAHTEALAEAENERTASKDLAARPNPDVVPANRGTVTTDVHRSLVDYAYDARHSGRC